MPAASGDRGFPPAAGRVWGARHWPLPACTHACAYAYECVHTGFGVRVVGHYQAIGGGAGGDGLKQLYIS